MHENPYKPPATPVTSQKAVPAEIEKKIRGGWIAGLISGTLTLGFTFFAVATGAMGELFDAWSLLDVLLVFALTFGIYRKSRIASTTMAAYFVLSKVWLYVETGTTNGLFMSFVFAYLFVQAMVGTYEYHRL